MTDTELTKWLIGYLRDDVADMKARKTGLTAYDYERLGYPEDIANLEAAIALLEGQKRG